MLYIRKKGFALINTIIVTSLIMTLSCLMFRLIINNSDFLSMNYIDDDIFSINSIEEEIIYDFMNILNIKSQNMQEGFENVKSDLTNEECIKDVYEEQNYDGNIDDSMENSQNNQYNPSIIFEDDFEEKSQENLLIYGKSENKLILKIPGEYDLVRIRELRYVIKENKILLIPTSHFYETNSKK